MRATVADIAATDMRARCDNLQALAARAAALESRPLVCYNVNFYISLANLLFLSLVVSLQTTTASHLFQTQRDEAWYQELADLQRVAVLESQTGAPSATPTPAPIPVKQEPNPSAAPMSTSAAAPTIGSVSASGETVDSVTASNHAIQTPQLSAATAKP